MASALPVLPAFPAEIAAETLVLVGIELKLVAELHEAYGSPAPGKFPERMSAYVGAWAHRRGVFMIEGGLIFAAGSPLARLLRRRLVATVTHLAFELRTNTPDALTAELAERAEARGYRSLWVNHPPDEDGLGHLAKMAAATMRITLGTAVVPIGAVPPDAILRRIDETHLPPERLRLGIGSGSGPQPLRRMADAVAYLRERTPAEIVVGALGPRM